MLNLTQELAEFDTLKVTANSLPSGLDFGKLARRAGDVKEVMLHQYKHGKKRGITTHVPEIDHHLTWKPGFLYAFTGWPQNGKSEVINFLALLKSKFAGWKWLMYPPETMPADEMFDQLAHTLVGQSTDPIYRNQMSLPDYLAVIDFLHEHIFVIDDDLLEEFGVQPTPENLRETARWFHDQYRISGFIKDPWNTLMHDLTIRDDQYLQEQLRQEKRLATSLQILDIILVHPKSWFGAIPDDGLPMPLPHNIANGAMWNNKCDVIGAVHRPNYFKDRTDRHAVLATHKVKKQHLVGKPGQIDMLFNPQENRYYINGRCPLVTPGLQPDTVKADIFGRLPESHFETEEKPPF
jgi:hypothetical protein